jgi:hypothetical protein
MHGLWYAFSWLLATVIVELAELSEYIRRDGGMAAIASLGEMKLELLGI